LNKKQSTLPTLALLTITGFATACSNSSSGDSQTAAASKQQEQTPAEVQIGSETQDASSENKTVELPESDEENDSTKQSSEAAQNGESSAEPSSETESTRASKRNSVMTPGYIWWRWGNEAIGHLSEPLPSVS